MKKKKRQSKWKRLKAEYGKAPAFKHWAYIRHACSVKTHPGYRAFGGRGARIQESWKNSFATFISDVGQIPGPDYKLALYNPNGHFTANNVRWICPKEANKYNIFTIEPVRVQ